MVGGQVARWMRRMLGTVARAHPAVLPDMAGDHPPGQADPSRVRVDGMVGTDARQPRVLAAPTLSSARQDPADRAELHGAARLWRGADGAPVTQVTVERRPFNIMKSVANAVARVYSPTVLSLRGHLEHHLAAPAAQVPGRPREAGG